MNELVCVSWIFGIKCFCEQKVARNWLSDIFGIQFVTLAEFAAMV